jgi:glutamate dehydrogenase (NAD(P)+)
MSAKELLPRAVMDEERRDPHLETMVEFEEAARSLDLEDWIVQRLRHTEREVSVSLPLVQDNGAAVTLTGLRVQHNSASGPTLGGVSFSPSAHIPQLRSLSMERTWQNALLGLPFGGAAGAVVCEPRELSEHELRLVSGRYVQQLRDLIGPHKDILAPDSGANSRTMAWMLAAYRRATGQSDIGAVCGKPAELHGWTATDAAGAAAVFLLVHLGLADRHTTLESQRVAIQGFGGVGAGVARLMHDAGARVVAVADISGGLFNAEGINVPALQTYVERNQVVLGFNQAEPVCNADVLEGDCDVLVLAAAERQITAANAARVQAPLLVEATRAAVTQAAAAILFEKDSIAIPDLLGTAGEPLTWFVEWSQVMQAGSTAELDPMVNARVRSAYQAVREAARRHQVSFRRAAHLVGIDKVAASLRMLGA